MYIARPENVRYVNSSWYKCFESDDLSRSVQGVSELTHNCWARNSSSIPMIFIQTMDDMTNTTNSTFIEEDAYEVDFYEVFLKEVFTIVGLISMTACSLLIFVILKYQALRQHITNIIMLHLLILEFVFFFVTSTTVRLLVDFELHVYVSMGWLCICVNCNMVLLFGILLFVILLLYDWHLKTFREEKYEKFGRVHKFCIIIVYFFIFCISGFTTATCHHDPNIVIGVHILFVFAVLICIIFAVLGLNVMYSIKAQQLLLSSPKSNNFGLIIGNIFVLSWLPAIAMILFNLVFTVTPLINVLVVGLGFLNPLFKFIYLYRQEHSFNVCLKKVFRCDLRNYDETILDNSSICYTNDHNIVINNTFVDVYYR